MRLWCQQASPVVAANSRPGPGRSPPWCSRDGGCVWHPQGRPSRTGSRPNDALHRAYPLPRSAPEGRQICEGYEALSRQKKMWVTVRPLISPLLTNFPLDSNCCADASDLRGCTLPPMGFPGSPERWWRDEALQAEAEAAQASGEQRHHAARDIPALRTRSLFSTGVRFSTASHIPVDTAQCSARASTRTSRSSRSVRAIWLSSKLKPRVLRSENMASMPQRKP